MDFLFHSVYESDDHSKFFNIYKIDDSHFLAQCHHFNRERDCMGDFEIVNENGKWKSSDPKFEEVAKQTTEEIERMTSQPRTDNEAPRQNDVQS